MLLWVLSADIITFECLRNIIKPYTWVILTKISIKSFFVLCVCVLYTGTAGFFSRILHPSFGGAYYTHVRAIHKTLQYLHPLERLEFVGDSFYGLPIFQRFLGT